MMSQISEGLFNLSDVAIAGKFADYRALGSVGSTTLLGTKDELIERLGEPKETRSYDADSAADRMLEAGESLFFELSGRILQAHVNENGVLSCLILRDAMPEDLY